MECGRHLGPGQRPALPRQPVAFGSRTEPEQPVCLAVADLRHHRRSLRPARRHQCRQQYHVNPNRARNCAAAGIPTTITFTDPTTGAQLVRPWTNQSPSNIPGVNQGNIGLTPEVGNSFTLGLMYQPQQVRGLTIKVDYYNVRVKNVISGLTGQQIVNRCYDDTNGINNPFCAAVFRRQSADPVRTTRSWARTAAPSTSRSSSSIALATASVSSTSRSISRP